MVSQGMIIGVGVLGALAVGGFLFFRGKGEEQEKRDEPMPEERPLEIRLPQLSDKIVKCVSAGGVWQSSSQTCRFPRDPQGDYEFISGGGVQNIPDSNVPQDMNEPKVDPIYEELGDRNF